MISFRFDGKNAAAQRHAKEHAAGLVTNVSMETRAAIRALVVRSIDKGIPPRSAAILIRRYIGLDAPQALAAEAYRETLVESGLGQKALNKALEKYTAKKIRERALTIARTETVDALSGGVLESWIQAEKAGELTEGARKHSVPTRDDKLCATCRAAALQRPRLTEPFRIRIGKRVISKQKPSFHPRCRCGLALVPG